MESKKSLEDNSANIARCRILTIVFAVVASLASVITGIVLWVRATDYGYVVDTISLVFGVLCVFVFPVLILISIIPTFAIIDTMFNIHDIRKFTYDIMQNIPDIKRYMYDIRQNNQQNKQ